MKYILTAITVLMTTLCFASWNVLPLEEVVTDSDMIVIATLTHIQKVTTNDRVYCRGDLQIAEVLKGGSSPSVIITWVYSIPPKSISVDHSNLEGKSVLWLLKQEKDMSFSANDINCIQPIDIKTHVQQIIKTHLKR